MEKIGYLGPQDSYSHLAALKFRPEARHLAYGSFPLLMQALVKGECTAIVLPIENSLNGGVSQNMDLLQCTQGVIAFERCAVKIDHRLATLKGADLRGISHIYSHQQALEQCGEYLFENFPNAKLIATPSTAASLELLQTGTQACIVGAHVKRAGIELSPRNIADEKNNITEFLLIKKGTAESLPHSEKIYFCAACRHEAGALYNLLFHLKEGGLNMTKIQSRPVKESFGEYRFFVEVDGNLNDSRVKSVLEEVERAANSFKILGAY